MVRLYSLVLASLVLGACFGHLTIEANIAVEPRPLLPGSRATLTLDIEGDGLLGNTIRQQLTPASFEQARMTGAEWELRDNSDSQNVRVRATSSGDFPGTFNAEKLPGAGVDGISIVANDYILFRTYRLTVTVPPSQSTSVQGTDQFSQQAASAALAAVRYGWSARLPGSVGKTNGLRSDDGRIIWNISISSTQPQVLTAESTYVDVPRIALGGGLVLVLGSVLLLGRRAGRVRGDPASARSERVALEED
jgi:hypothetical protein